MYFLSECDKFSPGLVLPSEASCYFSSSCDLVKCCFDAELVERSFLVFLQLESCNNRLKFGVEKSEYFLSLKDYVYGTVEKFDLNGFIMAE